MSIRTPQLLIPLLLAAALSMLCLTNQTRDRANAAGKNKVVENNSTSLRVETNGILASISPAQVPPLKNKITSDQHQGIHILIDGLQWVSTPTSLAEEQLRIRFKVLNSKGTSVNIIDPYNAINVVTEPKTVPYLLGQVRTNAVKVPDSLDWYADIPDVDPATKNLQAHFDIHDPKATELQSGRIETLLAYNSTPSGSGTLTPKQPETKLTTSLGTAIYLSGCELMPVDQSKRTSISLGIAGINAAYPDDQISLEIAVYTDAGNLIGSGLYMSRPSQFPQPTATLCSLFGGSPPLGSTVHFKIDAIENIKSIASKLEVTHLTAKIPVSAVPRTQVRYSVTSSSKLTVGNVAILHEQMVHQHLGFTDHIIWLSQPDKLTEWRAINFACANTPGAQMLTPVQVHRCFWHGDGTPAGLNETGELIRVPQLFVPSGDRFQSFPSTETRPMIFALQSYRKIYHNLKFSNITLPQEGKRISVNQSGDPGSDPSIALTAVVEVPGDNTAPPTSASSKGQLEMEFTGGITRSSTQKVILNSAFDNRGWSVPVEIRSLNQDVPLYEDPLSLSPGFARAYTAAPAPGATSYSFSGKIEEDSPIGNPTFVEIDSSKKMTIIPAP
jgi:hypothetical protein